MTAEVSIFEEHREDLFKSGLSEETIRSAGIQSQHANGHLANAGVRTLMVFPYRFNPKAIGFKRYKLFPALKDPKGNTMKYFAPKDSKNHLYITKQADNVKDDISQAIYITEGEKKALAASQNGFPCIGLSGLWSWKDKKVEELIEDFNLFVWNNRKVYLIPDNDFQDEKHTGLLKMAICRLASKLLSRGAKVFLIEIPRGAEKGIDDFLWTHTPDDFKDLIKKAEPLEKKGLPNEEIKSKMLYLSKEELEDLMEKVAPPEYLNILADKIFSFSQMLAARIGLTEAIVLHKIHGWLRYNFEKKFFHMVKDGRLWMFRGYAYFHKEMPFLSKSTITRAIRKLEKLDLLIVGNYNDGPGNNTKWYSINYPYLEELLK